MQKQLILGLFVLLILFSVSYVSAEDNQTSDGTFTVMDENSNTFTDISSKINSSSDTIYLNNQTYIGNSEISITKSITIDGATPSNENLLSTLDAQDNCRIFKITTPGTSTSTIDVTLKNLIIKNGLTNQSGAGIYGCGVNLILDNVYFIDNDARLGGAIYVYDTRTTVTANNCNFINNSATSGAGGVYIYYSTAIFNNCNFTNNAAIRPNTTGYSGGAIYSYGQLTVNNCNFVKNYGLYGGAIINDEKVAIIKDSNFILNVAITNSGSAIYNYETTAKLQVSGCYFKSNLANNKGSGIYNYNGEVDVSNSTFINNIARTSALLFNDGGKLNVTKSIFKGNVGVNGSVIYNTNTSWSYFTPQIGILIINESNFEYNIPNQACEIVNEGILKIYNSNLTGNFTLIQNHGNLTLSNNNLTSNKYYNIFNDGKILSPTNIIILNNSTVNCFINEDVNISAIFVDLDNNTIGDYSLKFIIDGVEEKPTLLSNGSYVKDMKFSKSGQYPVGASLDFGNYTTKEGLINILPHIDLNASANNVTYPDSVIVKVNSTDGCLFNLLVLNSQNSTIYNKTVRPGNIYLDYLNVGDYNAILTFAGDDKFSPTTTEVNFKVLKNTPQLSVNSTNITYGENLIVNVTLSNLTTQVNVTINNTNHKLNLVNGKGSLLIPNLNAGNYTLNVNYSNEPNYTPVNKTLLITVNKASINLKLIFNNITYGQEVIGEIILNQINTKRSSNQASVYLTINNVTRVVNLTNGFGRLTINNLNTGRYVVSASYLGNDNFLPAINQTVFNVGNANTTIAIKINNTTYTNPIIGFIQSQDLINGTVAVTINNQTFNVTITNGKATFTKDMNLTPGTYKANITVNASNYNLVSNSTTFRVSPIAIYVSNITVPYGFGANATIVLSVPLNTTVTVVFNNNTYSLNLTNGFGQFKIPKNTEIGNYTLSVNFNNQTATSLVKITPTYNVSFTKTVNKNNAILNEQVVFTITVKNHDDIIYNITVLDLIDSNYFQLVSVVYSNGFYNQTTGILTAQLNKTTFLQITVKLIAIGEALNSAKLTIDGFNNTLISNATVNVINNSNINTTTNNTTQNEPTNTTSFENTEKINNTIKSKINDLKTANPILLLLLAIFLISLRRKII